MQQESIFINQKGATAVESAIVLFLLLTLIFGMIEFSGAMFIRQGITNAAREGARAGIVSRPERLSNDDIAKIVVDYAHKHLIVLLTADDVHIDDIDEDLSDGLAPDKRCVVFEFEYPDGVFHRCDLEVTVNYTYPFLFLSILGIGPVHLQATSVMKME